MNLSRIVERWADLRSEHVAIHFQGEDIAYATLWRRVEAGTLRLASLGIHQGDRVAYLGYNHPELLAILFACARLGAMLVPLNFRLARAEHQDILAHADPSVLVADADFTAHAESMRQRFPLVKLVGLRSAPDGWFSWQGLPPSGFEPKLRGTDADSVLIVYTSGITGKPKGAVHTQASLLCNIVNA